MVTRKLGSLLIPLVLIVCAAVFAPAAQAQGGSRTFPETGRTVGGTFLQYWNRHGGLAQQGLPISEEIQETSSVDSKTYTVQYFERAVFEQHPENQPPYNVLLSLLGVFRYQQKYPQGAPNQVPNNEPNSRLFPETGKRLGGLFRTYWESHGGLAQQGLPISEEFDEVSDLNGQTYKVQYFERAVFEYHPENQPPYNVLLSQLGTFRQREKYGSLNAQLSGNNNQNTSPFTLKAGLALFQSVRSANSGYFYIDVYGTDGNQIATIASGSGPRDLSVAVKIPVDGTYVLQVQSEGGWTVNVSQPQAGYAPPPPSQRWSDKYWNATPLFSLHAGPVVFHALIPNNSTNFEATLLNQNREFVGELQNRAGAPEQTTTVNIPADGVYLIQVYSDGDWTVDVQQ